jgi:predicted permease
LSLLKYASAADHAQFYNTLETALEAEPEISAAGLVSVLPLSGGLPNGRLDLDGDLSKSTVAGYVLATPGYFDVLGIRLTRGRLFDGRDGPNDAHVVVVSESFAENAWPGENPIGHQVSGGGMDALWEERPFATVVGVVSDLHYRSLAREPDAVAYFPPLQRPSRLRYESNIVVKAADGNAGGATAALRRTLNRADPDVPPRFQTMESRVSGSLDERRFMLYVLGGFAVVALILAVVGIYGVVSYSVARRTREIGIRLALGAEPAMVRRQVQSHAMTMVGVGVAVGIVASAVAGRLLTSLLFGVSPADPLTLSAVAVVLLATAWLGVAVPARRSTRVDPLTTMRAE